MPYSSPGFLYLASPYSHPDPEVRDERFDKAVRAAQTLALLGNAVFAPVVQGRSLEKGDILPSSHDFWMSIDLPILAKAKAVIILPLPGWEDSKGMAMEIRLAESLKIPVYEFAKFLEAK